MKARLAALSLLDRALAAVPDDELVAAITALPEEHQKVLDRLAGLPDDVEADADRVAPLRAAAARGRVNGGLEQIAAVVSDRCLADCIEQLGDAADNPSRAQLEKVLPGIAERHGVPLTRVMMASAVAGEAPASPALVQLLKQDELLKLPPAPPPTPTVRLAAPAEDPERAALREKRKARRDQERAAARARREQSQRDRAR